MLFLVIDPESQYIMKERHTVFTYHQIPKTSRKAGKLNIALHKQLVTGEENIVLIEDVDKLKDKQAAEFAYLLSLAPPQTKILLTATNEHEISDHIKNLLPKISYVKKSSGKKVKSFFQKMNGYISSHDIPEDDDLFILFKTIGTTPGMSIKNIELCMELDNLLFKTHSEYLATAWAGAHQPQSVRLVYKKGPPKPVKAKIVKPKKVAGTKARRPRKKKSKHNQASLNDYF